MSVSLTLGNSTLPFAHRLEGNAKTFSQLRLCQSLLLPQNHDFIANRFDIHFDTPYIVVLKRFTGYMITGDGAKNNNRLFESREECVHLLVEPACKPSASK